MIVTPLAVNKQYSPLPPPPPPPTTFPPKKKEIVSVHGVLSDKEVLMFQYLFFFFSFFFFLVMEGDGGDYTIIAYWLSDCQITVTFNLAILYILSLSS